MHRIVSFVVLVVIALVFGALFFHVIAGFLVPLFLALVLVVLFRPLYVWMVGKCRGRARVAAVLTTMSVLLSVLIPIAFVLAVAGVELAGMIADFNHKGAQFRAQVDQLRQQFELTLPEPVADVDDRMAALIEDAALADEKALKDLISAVQESLARLDETIPALAQAEPAIDATPVQRALKGLRIDLVDLSAAQPRTEVWNTALAAAEKDYHLLRARLIPLYLEADGDRPSRFDAWLILHANPTRKQLTELQSQILDLLGLSLAVSTGTAVGRVLLGSLFGLIVMSIALYYFLADGPEMIGSLMRLSPLDRRYVSQLLGEFDKVSRAVVLATLLSAAAQGILGGIGYWLAGFDSIFLLTVLTLVLAMVPFVGATAVWGPCCLWLLLVEQRTAAAVVLAIYGAAVVSAVDNLIKPYVLHGHSNLHPLLALLSVLGGVQALGPIGIFVGPMAVAFLQALLQMLQGELRDIEKKPTL